MIAKGLDFPEVTLVGVLNADTSLNFRIFVLVSIHSNCLPKFQDEQGEQKKQAKS